MIARQRARPGHPYAREDAIRIVISGSKHCHEHRLHLLTNTNELPHQVLQQQVDVDVAKRANRDMRYTSQRLCAQQPGP